MSHIHKETNGRLRPSACPLHEPEVIWGPFNVSNTKENALKSGFGDFLTCQTLREMKSKGEFAVFLTCQTLRKMNSKSEFGDFLTCQTLREMK